MNRRVLSKFTYNDAGIFNILLLTENIIFTTLRFLIAIAFCFYFAL